VESLEKGFFGFCFFVLFFIYLFISRKSQTSDWLGVRMSEDKKLIRQILRLSNCSCRECEENELGKSKCLSTTILS